MRTGRVQARAKPLERAWERVFKEAGASVHFQHLLRASTLSGIDPGDNRCIDVLATGLPLYRGKALFCDATLRSPLKGNGCPQPRASKDDGATFKGAVRDKHQKYPELLRSPVAKLLVLACEVGGRWNSDCLDVISKLAEYKAASSPLVLRRSVRMALEARWWSVLGLAAQGAFAASLLAQNGPRLVLDVPAAFEPELADLLDAQRWE